MSEADPRTDQRRWRPRPLLSFALRFVSVLVPAVAGAASAYGFVITVAMPNGAGIVLWAVGLALTSTFATALAERVGKRFLPLALLLRLSLVFPDRAPSRFAMARGAGNVRHLEQRIRDAREHGVDETPARAAEQILSLVAALSAHDRKTRGHSERVRVFTDLVADELRVADEDRDQLRWAALLHDIGKLRVPARILNKPGRPEPREWETLKRHPAAGAQIAAPLLPWLGAWGSAIEQHHERFDGDGYPNGLAGEHIALAARIVGVADSFEVMTAARSYKKPMSVPAARRELAACAGGQFDPSVVRAFLNISLGKLWWTVGPTSWTALLPLVGSAQRAGGQLVGAARAAAAAIVVSAGGLVPFLAGTATAREPGVVPATAPASQFVGQDRVGPVTHPPVTGVSDGDDPAGTGTDGGDDPGTGGGSNDGTGGDLPGTPGVGDDPVGAVQDVVDGTTGALDGAVDTTTGVVEDVVGVVTDVVADPVNGVTEAVDGVLPAATDVVDDAVDAVTDVAGGLLGH
jgi:putative nucleotidyltransferase with HDIG domain